MAASSSASVEDLLAHGPNRHEIGRKQVTLALGGLYIASTTETAKPLLVWETEKPYGRYYVPIESLHPEIKAKFDGQAPNGHVRGVDGSKLEVSVSTTETKSNEGSKAKAVIEKLVVGNSSTTWVRFVEGPLKGFVRFERAEIDQLFENGAISVAIKNPYKRIDTTAVSRHITVHVDNTLVAETNTAVLLNETGLPETYYIPATSIKDWSMTSRSDLRTACPYKGEAWYLNLDVKGKKWENLIWYYQYPTHESAAVEGFISFYKKDGVEVRVDGVKI